jgi:hypothetical protein
MVDCGAFDVSKGHDLEGDPVRLRSAAALTAAAVVASLAPLALAAPAAQAACASNSGRSISGTVFGEDGRDVNVSIGFDVVDANGRALDTDPASTAYGCAKTGGYSVPQTYLNHFVGPEGAAPRERTLGWSPYERVRKWSAPVMPDGEPTRRDWTIGNLPSNATGAYIEVYHRGYTGSPCKDANGNYCFNPPTLTKYGYANKHVVPVGTKDLPIRLPMTCAYGGTAGSISGKILDAAGRPVAVKSLYAWTEHTWNAPPFVHGWGSARFSSDGSYVIPSLASRQSYVLWLTAKDGTVHKRAGVTVDDCKATAVSWRV